MSTKHQAVCDGCRKTAEPVTSSPTTFLGSTSAAFPSGWITLVVQQHLGPSTPFVYPADPGALADPEAFREAMAASAAAAPKTVDLCPTCAGSFRDVLGQLSRGPRLVDEPINDPANVTPLRKH